MEAISDRYREFLGLDFIYSTNYYNSGVDQCKGTVTSSNIDSLCGHTSNHTGYQSVKSSFTSDSSASNTLTDAYWTGHKIDTTGMGRVYTTSYNRSFSSRFRIYMLELCNSTNCEYNSKSVLMHKLNHQYGAPDHYHEILADGTCRGGALCSVCGSNPRPATCIMCQGCMDITSDNVICDGCKGQMITHLEGHHIN